MRRASISTSGWTRRSAISPASRTTATQEGHRLRRISRRPATPSRSTSSARTSSTSTPCSGRRCSSSPATRCPNNVYVHGFITVSGEKMSKSRGTGISPLRYLEIGMNPEWLRYYIAAKLNANVEDVDFNPDDFMARVNSDLIGKYVNIASRCAGFITVFQAIRRKAIALWQRAIRSGDSRGCLHKTLHPNSRSCTKRASLAKRYRAKSCCAWTPSINFVDERKPWELAQRNDPSSRKSAAAGVLGCIADVQACDALPQAGSSGAGGTRRDHFLNVPLFSWNDAEKYFSRTIIESMPIRT